MKDVGAAIPSTSALLAFEATARLGSIAHAAEELEVSSPAISRHISKLERTLNVRLFERKGRGLILTRNGEDYFVSVQSSIQSLRAAGKRLNENKATIVILCSQGLSAMILLPLYPMLRRLLDENIDLRILNSEIDMLPSLLPVGIDLHFDYATALSDEHAVKLFDEEIVPVASPSFIERFERELAEHPSRWLGVPRLDMPSTGGAWATWEKFFHSQNCQSPEAPIEYHENYLYLAEAAATARGVALGWNGFVNGYFETGRLVPIRNEWFRTRIGVYAVLTAAGQRSRSARGFLTVLTDLARELRAGSEELKCIRERWTSRQPEAALQQFHVPGRDGCTAI